MSRSTFADHSVKIYPDSSQSLVVQISIAWSNEMASITLQFLQSQMTPLSGTTESPRPDNGINLTQKASVPGVCEMEHAAQEREMKLNNKTLTPFSALRRLIGRI